MQYRKKPIVIEALHLDAYMTTRAVLDFVGQAGTIIAGGVEIETLEGTMRAEIGDWIIRGIKGEFYPCKPDIFEATYEVVDAANPA